LLEDIKDEQFMVTIHLTPEFERLVRDKVQTGRYNSATEVVEVALRLLHECDQHNALRKHEVQERITQGLESLRLGKGIDGEPVFQRLEAELDEHERRSKP
jgi:antitoxin ParD1/3/4